MKQSNFKGCVTGLTLCVCLFAGSAIATAKAGNWHAIPSQNQEQDLFVMDTKFRVEYARELKSKEQVLNATQEKGAKKLEMKKPETKKLEVKLKPKAVASSLSLKKMESSKKPKVSAKKEASNVKSRTLEITPGNTITYSRLIPVQATAYTAAAEENGLWGAYDYYGNPLKVGTIAVDPDVIPMGSTVYITGYSFDGLPAKGMIGKATDQGSGVQGKHVDIFLPISHADATKFGMQDVKVYIIK
ncbi:MAG: 3D domain-containing protein [Paenibacillaceae bacterium]